MATRIIYPELPIDTTHVTVEPLERERARELAPAILDLIVASYGGQFEGSGKPLPHGVFAAKYGTGKAVRRFQNTVIPRVFDRGGAYYAIREPADTTRLASVLKILPGEQVHGRFANMVGIAEVLTDPRRQRQGYAAALVHAHLKYRSVQDARLMLDAFEESPVNDWYEYLGFQEEESSGELELGDHALPTRYMVTPEDIAVAGVVQRLEAKHPALRSGEVVP